MSQKSILSFFKSSATNTKETKSVVVKDSPVKKTRNKRKVQCLESDDESSVVKSIDLKGDSNKATEVSENGIEKSSKPSSKNESKEKSEVKENGTHSSGKPSKVKKIENGEEKIAPESPKKAETNGSIHKEDCVEPSTSLSKDSGNKTEDISGTLDQNGIVDFIPKRKTARKQISSAKRRRDNLKVVKDQPESSENGISNNSAAVKDSKNSPERNSSDEMSDSVILMDTEDASEKEHSSKGVSDEVTSMDIEKDSKKEKSPKDIKKSKGGKSKANSSSKEKGSPVKKSTKKESISTKKESISTKKESIHSFFTPLKKAENKSNDEEKTKKCDQEEIEDSPVKKTKTQKKKLQCLESDDENEDCEEPDSSVTNETKENCSTSPGKKEDSIKASENSADEEKEPSSKKVDVEPSKSDVEKQKLGLKSTSVDTNVYDPSKNNYHPINDACWKQGEKVPYLALAKTLELIENTSGRLKIVEILANFLRSVIVLSPDDMLQSVYLCLNRLAPEYCGIELGVGETLLMKAVAQATGRTLEKIKAEVAVKGDLGLVSESSRGNQRVMFAPPKLTVSSVFQKFLEIAKMSGNASMAKKTDKIKVLFVACRDCEAKYIIRSLSGKLRIGLAEQSVLSAIARSAVLTPPGQTYPPKIIDGSKGMSSDSFKEHLDSQILILKTAYCECPNYDLIIPVLLKEGISALPERCQLSPGVPLKPMLAHPTAGIDKVLERFDKNAFTCEFKYDGERAQIHMTEKGEVKIFSRNQEDNTSKYPDIISRLPNALNETTKTFILDSEAVAWDKETKQILPFQVLSTRKKKDAVESEIKVQVCIMAFDLLYLNGESLIKKPLKERRSLLHSSFNEVENEFMFAQYKDGNSAETMQEFLDESVKGNCEGLMVKALETDASYEIAKRSHNWLKLKKDYLQGIGDTLDLVVIGGYYGKGKRTGNYGGFLLACYDDDNEEFQSICKLGTGFKDDNLEAHTKFLKQHTIKEPKSYFRYDHSLEPDEWFEPVQVWEIKCADLSVSPVHKAAMGIVDPEKGISLRFPRFIRIRDDKTPENATNSVQIADMYQKQEQIQNTANKNAKVEEDYY